MSERLNFEQACLESLAYRELGGENATSSDFNEISQRIDSSRTILSLATDEKLSELAEKLTVPYEFRVSGVKTSDRTAVSYAISDMPYVNPERALAAYKKQADRYDMTAYGRAFIEAASYGLKALTLLKGDATIDLYRRYHDMASPGIHRDSNIRDMFKDDVIDLGLRDDFELSDDFVRRVISRNIAAPQTHRTPIRSPYISVYPSPSDRHEKINVRYELARDREILERETEIKELREDLKGTGLL